MYKNSLKVIHPRMKCYYSRCKLGGLHIPTINSSFLLRRYSYTPDLKDTSPTSNFSKITDRLSTTADTELSPSKTANISCPWAPWAGKCPSPGSLPAHLDPFLLTWSRLNGWGFRPPCIPRRSLPDPSQVKLSTTPTSPSLTSPNAALAHLQQHKVLLQNSFL